MDGMDRIQNDESKNSSIAAWVYLTAVTFSLRRCLQTTNGYTYRHTNGREGFMKYAVEMGSGTIIYLPSFTLIASGIKKLIGGIHRDPNNMMIS
jgi:hypothetical protein